MWIGAYRVEIRGVDGEEGELVDFGSEERELRVEGSKGESDIARGELMGMVEEEGVFGGESDPECEAVESLNLSIGAGLVKHVCVHGGGGGIKIFSHNQH